MTDPDRPRGPWLRNSETAVDLINDLHWSGDDEEMAFLRELTLFVSGERDRIRFEIGQREATDA